MYNLIVSAEKGFWDSGKANFPWEHYLDDATEEYLSLDGLNNGGVARLPTIFGYASNFKFPA